MLNEKINHQTFYDKIKQNEPVHNVHLCDYELINMGKLL